MVVEVAKLAGEPGSVASTTMLVRFVEPNGVASMARCI
jgi:hypothetical protein